MSPNKQNFFLKCFLKGWPPPRVVWYSGDRQMINGSQGFYHIEERRSQCDQAILESTLHFPPAREEYDGCYNCSAENNFNGWSSKYSAKFEVIYDCKSFDLFPFITKI